jgi:hypothetical protein
MKMAQAAIDVPNMTEYSSILTLFEIIFSTKNRSVLFMSQKVPASFFRRHIQPRYPHPKKNKFNQNIVLFICLFFMLRYSIDKP